MNVIDLLKSHGIEPKRASNHKGGEYHSPCPRCGGKDRFHVWPEQNNGSGSYWCRPTKGDACGCSGDNIQFLIDFEGCTYPEACRRLGMELKKDYQPRPMVPQRQQKAAKASCWEPRIYERPPEKWREKAEKFILWAHSHLLKSPDSLKYLKGRGINQETAELFKLGLNVGEPGKNGVKDIFRPRVSWGLPEEYRENGKKKALWIPRGIVIPMIDEDGSLNRVRIRRPENRYPEKPKYWAVPGSSGATLIIGKDKQAFVIVESELDAMAVYQAAGDLVGVVGLGSSSTRPDDKAAELLRSSLVILNTLDSDGTALKDIIWWRDHFSQVDRWPVSSGKDPGEAFAAGVDLRQWILAGLPPRFKMKTKKKSGVVKAEKQFCGQVQEPDPGLQENIPPGMLNLSKLMQGHPVSIIHQADQLKIEHPPEWSSANWDLLTQISQSLYFDAEVFEAINRLPFGRYTAQKILAAYNEEASNKKAPAAKAS